MPTEADTCRKFVVPKLQAAGWDNEPYSIAEQRTITDGRIVPVGKTYTAVNFVYRLIKLAGACRVLFLVDRGNLGDQTLKEFQQFVTPDDGRKFTELYNVQHLQRSQREAVRHRREARRVDARERIDQSAQLDRVSRVCISTIQRLYSMLRGEASLWWNAIARIGSLP
jgi:type I site-specific restriction endonuclease